MVYINCKNDNQDAQGFMLFGDCVINHLNNLWARPVHV